MYNPTLDILYDIEHGDRTDDEINVLYDSMNYGWKYVRGYHTDNNFPGEASFIANYIPNTFIPNDSLVQPLYSWCAVMPDTSSNYLDWCTVAPSGGIYYGSNGISAWSNSLLVVTLKNGLSTDQELFQFKLQANGELESSTAGNPNPKKFFGADQFLNGRLRDIAVSPDGQKIFLINNGGAPTDKISVYTYDSTSTGLGEFENATIRFYPNPAKDFIMLESKESIKQIVVYNVIGMETIRNNGANIYRFDISALTNGIYTFKILTVTGKEMIHQFVKQ